MLVHGVFWSGLLTGVRRLHDEHPARRAAGRKGSRYWGLSTIAAIAVAPSIGFWMYPASAGAALCLEAARPEHRDGDHRVAPAAAAASPSLAGRPPRRGRLVEWRILILSFTLFLYSFGYGGITSFTALYADANGVDAEGDLPDDAGGGDPADAAAGRAAGRSVRLPAGVPALPGADCRRACRAWSLGGTRFWLVTSAIDLRRRASARPTRCLPAT